MPETRFTLRWPDGQIDECYSPSTVVLEFLKADTTYPLEEFLDRCREALEQASRRVEAKFGFRCTSADAQLSAIERKASTFTATETVTCLSIS
ncbi:family protein [Tritonibacter multivorans]|uniref:Family protein n=1 Tax=Tritonibacter multivorans TaxID=928856 RepID=A0A0P1GBB7_9RHOB|nr:MSMEG_0570 family nitrogen starvation response protein [Tritonibacter multivorans]MDA7422001.1 MSMEG_0570 family nitrogen starvation response protein [Tritonibacter multivorans]CUH78687.1 family protein [Tritonibacter multivorans]SFD66065.1 MSMEG_0570 family protein [Tritonibacter multivorans]